MLSIYVISLVYVDLFFSLVVSHNKYLLLLFASFLFTFWHIFISHFVRLFCFSVFQSCVFFSSFTSLFLRRRRRCRRRRHHRRCCRRFIFLSFSALARCWLLYVRNNEITEIRTCSHTQDCVLTMIHLVVLIPSKNTTREKKCSHANVRVFMYIYIYRNQRQNTTTAERARGQVN